MFDRLTETLSAAVRSLSGRGRLSEDNIADTVRQVRLALLEADVALPVVKTFTDAVKARAVGVEVTKSLTPGQAFIKVVHDELTSLMGEASTGLNLRAQRPVVVMLAGLQGAGKTTTAGKLARWLIEKQHKKVLLASTTSTGPRQSCSSRRWPARWVRDSRPRRRPRRRSPSRSARSRRQLCRRMTCCCSIRPAVCTSTPR